MDVKHEMERQFPIKIGQSVLPMPSIKSRYFIREEFLGIFQVLCVIRFSERTTIFFTENLMFQIFRAGIVVLISEQIGDYKSFWRPFPTDILCLNILYVLIPQIDTFICSVSILWQVTDKLNDLVKKNHKSRKPLLPINNLIWFKTAIQKPLVISIEFLFLVSVHRLHGEQASIMIAIRLKIQKVLPEIAKLRILPGITSLIVRYSKKLILKNLR